MDIVLALEIGMDYILPPNDLLPPDTEGHHQPLLVRSITTKLDKVMINSKEL